MRNPVVRSMVRCYVVQTLLNLVLVCFVILQRKYVVISHYFDSDKFVRELRHESIGDSLYAFDIPRDLVENLEASVYLDGNILPYVDLRRTV
jgi:hypothetical protein